MGVDSSVWPSRSVNKMNFNNETFSVIIPANCLPLVLKCNAVQLFTTQTYFQNILIIFTFSVVGLYFFSAFFLNLILAVTFFIGANATVLCKSAADLSLLENVSN